MPWKSCAAVLAAGLMIMGIASPYVASAAERAWMGVFLQEYDDKLKDAMEHGESGVLVSRVVEGGPADQAGLRRGDLIVRVDGRQVSSVGELTDLVADARVGESLDIDYMRGSRWESARVVLADYPEDDEGPRVAPTPPTPPAPATPPAPPAEPRVPRITLDDDWVKDMQSQMRRNTEMFRTPNRGRLGVQIENVDRDDAYGASRGVRVTEVMDDTPAERAGIRSGDIITRVDGEPIDDTGDLVRRIRGSEDGRLTIELVRRGSRRTVEAQLDRTRITTRRSFGTPAPRARAYGNDGDDRVGQLSRENEELREELRQLREELRQLKEDMRR
jgi:serine protease Do